MLFNDVGITIEIFGFLLLLLTANRNPHGSLLALEEHKACPIDHSLD